MKRSACELAILGGTPAFSETLHVGRPNIGNRDRLMDRISDILDRRWLTNNGPFVQELERRLADMLEVKHCIAVCNATLALQLMVKALGLTGEVIIPAFTFIATAHALQWQEITPVFCDIDPVTHNIDPERVEELITPRTTGIIGVHLWGRPCNIEALGKIANKYSLKLAFDAAHALGCSYHGAMIGGFGEAEVLSFHATKFINTLEGGAITTNNSDLAAKLRLMKNFGFSGNFDSVIYIGTNGKMNEVSAAMGLTSLESADSFVEINHRNYLQYQQEIASIPGIELISYPKEKCNYQYIVLEVDEAAAGISRDVLNQVLHAENVITRRYFYPGCHKMEPYRSRFPNASSHLSETERIASRVLQLPTGTAASSEQIAAICRIIRIAVANGPDVTDFIQGVAEGTRKAEREKVQVSL